MVDIENRTFDFSCKLIHFCKRFLEQNFLSQIILRQLLRAGASIGANTTEGRASSSKKDFINFHYHALKSARETIYWLRLLEVEYENTETKKLINEAGEISKILGKIVVNSRKNL